MRLRDIQIQCSPRTWVCLDTDSASGLHKTHEQLCASTDCVSSLSRVSRRLTQISDYLQSAHQYAHPVTSSECC